MSDIQVKLDISHFMKRIASTCTTESHPLYPKFLRQLSGCSFQWCSEDLEAPKPAKEALLAKEAANRRDHQERTIFTLLSHHSKPGRHHRSHQ